MNIVTNQVFQIIGAILILGAFAGAQADWLHQKSPAYLLPNLVGSTALAGAAIASRQWGFLLLEGTWALTSLAALATTIARPAVKLRSVCSMFARMSHYYLTVTGTSRQRNRRSRGQNGTTGHYPVADGSETADP